MVYKGQSNRGARRVRGCRAAGRGETHTHVCACEGADASVCRALLCCCHGVTTCLPLHAGLKFDRLCDDTDDTCKPIFYESTGAQTHVSHHQPVKRRCCSPGSQPALPGLRREHQRTLHTPSRRLVRKVHHAAGGFRDGQGEGRASLVPRVVWRGRRHPG